MRRSFYQRKVRGTKFATISSFNSAESVLFKIAGLVLILCDVDVVLVVANVFVVVVVVAVPAAADVVATAAAVIPHSFVLYSYLILLQMAHLNSCVKIETYASF